MAYNEDSPWDGVLNFKITKEIGPFGPDGVTQLAGPSGFPEGPIIFAGPTVSSLRHKHPSIHCHST